MIKTKTEIFIEENTGKHQCKCGCGGHIKVLKSHKYSGIPKFIHGHHAKYKNPMEGKKHSEQFKASRRRDGNPNWHGGKSIDYSGYVRVLDAMHPLADVKGYVKEHILVWVNANGAIPTGCVIHHENGKKDDNRLENLEMMTASEHNRLTFLGNAFGQKYCESEVIIWAEMHDKGQSYQTISDNIGIDKTTVFKRVKKHRAKYPLPLWASHQIMREDGLIEDICKDNSIGHPNAEYLRIHDPDGSKMLGVHCCDSCCCKGDD